MQHIRKIFRKSALEEPAVSIVEAQFQEVFGISPYGNQLIRNHKYVNFVEPKMQLLAAELDEVFQIEIHAQKLSKKRDANKDELESLVEFVEQEKPIRKKAFWHAHKLARDTGYKVLGKYKDYLDF